MGKRIFYKLKGKLTKTDEKKKIELLFKFFSSSSTFNSKEDLQLDNTNEDGNQSADR